MDRQRGAWTVVVVAIAAAIGLVLPWASSGSVSRSSIELIGSASALDLLSGVERWALVGGWFAVVAAAAGGLVATAWHRVDGAAFAMVGIGPALVVAVLVLRRSPLSPEWGAYAASGLGIVASMGSGLLLWPRRPWKGSDR